MYWETVTPLLKEVLVAVMREELFLPFRLVGGTSLSLQCGHRSSVDIDLFTDAAYGSIEFNLIDNWFRHRYAVVKTHHVGSIGFGISYYIGHSMDELLKVDLYYTDPFIRPLTEQEGIRMADEEDIVAMKLNMVGQGGRKKDFWDLYEVCDRYRIAKMISIYHEREPYGYSSEDIRKGFQNFAIADDDLDPICLRGRQWEIIKYDLLQWLRLE